MPTHAGNLSVHSPFRIKSFFLSLFFVAGTIGSFIGVQMDNKAQTPHSSEAPQTPLESCVAWFREQQRSLGAFAELQSMGALDTEDLLAESLKRVASAVTRGLVPPLPEQLTPYCLRVIRNTAIDAKRRLEVRRRTEGAYAADGTCQRSAVDFERASAAAEARDDRNRAMQLLRQLPPAQAEVVLLRIWQGMNYQAISAVLGIPSTTAQSRYNAAIARLQTLFRNHHE